MAKQIADAAPPRRECLANVEEAARYLSLSRASVYSLMASGELRYVKIGKSRRIPWDALDELVQKNTVAV